ncbi:hypothetical protein [Kitasatospora azatica]|uniref:hypothetical protein n=1 Tax=Kitasatospora azatica TaxID=58347 RepID=UPI000559D81B|nr:hypothetical protein [Kitasatospora azatica]
MSSALSLASASDADHRAKPRLKGRHRVLTVASVLLALVGGTVAEAGTAIAQPPSGACTQTCNNPPAGVSPWDWDAALEAADFWANHRIDWGSHTYNQGNTYAWLTYQQNAGWPGEATGDRWLGYYEPAEPNHPIQFIYYGGRFNDWDNNLSAFEQHRGVSPLQAYGTYRDSWGNTHYSPYVEYDMDYYPNAQVPRNARRIVRNTNNGDTFATFDHYQSWNYLGRY